MSTLEDLIADLRAQADNPNIAPWIRITLRSSSVVCQQLQLAKLQIQQNTDEIRRENDRLSFMRSQEEFHRNQEEYARRENERLSLLKSHEEFMQNHNEYMRNGGGEGSDNVVEKQDKLSISGDEGFAENRIETFTGNAEEITSFQTERIGKEYLTERNTLLLSDNNNASSQNNVFNEDIFTKSSRSNSISADPSTDSFVRSDSFTRSFTQEYARQESYKNTIDETENDHSTANDVLSFDCHSNYSESFLKEEEMLNSRINEVDLYGLNNTTSTIGKDNSYFQDDVLTEKTLDDSILDSIYDEDRYILDMDLTLDPIKNL